MKRSTFDTNLTPQDRLGRAIASRLDDSLPEVPHDVSERLKVARTLALAKRRIASLEASGYRSNGASAILQGGEDGFGFWGKLGSVLPLVALVIGLMLIDVFQEEMFANEAAQVDAALLLDELPPAAYTDPGFSHYLRAQQSD